MGKVAFNYKTAEVRLDIQDGEGSPWKLRTTSIVHTRDCVHGDQFFNCTADVYQTAGKDRCWVYTQKLTNIPNHMGGNLNLTYNGTATVDGFLCMVWWSSSTGITFNVRLQDLAIVQIDLPYILSRSVPFFSFFGLGSAVTRIDFSDIVVGTPDPASFNAPDGVCLHTNPNDPDKQFDVSNFLSLVHPNKAVRSEEIDPLYLLSKRLDTHLQEKNFRKKNSVHQPTPPPRLNQQFSGSWTLNASVSLTPPFTAYFLAGDLAFDFTTSGLAYSLTSITGNIPLDLQMEWRMYPDRNGIEFLQVGPDKTKCYSYLFLQFLWTFLLPQFQIPYDSIPMGSATINGDLCSVWQTTYRWFGENPSMCISVIQTIQLFK